MNIEDIIKNSNSQVGQDIFAYYLCNTNNGYFIDFGAGVPIHMNNTYLLEKMGWDGINFDSFDFRKEFRENRNSSFIMSDLNILNVSNFLKSYNVPMVIDYLSLDIDDSTKFFLLNNFPDEYEFKVITFEHNLYKDSNLKGISKKFFLEKGYTLLCENVAVSYETNHDIFEDWYINEKYIKNFDYLRCFGLHYTEIINRIKNHEKELKICVYTLCLNDEIILPFFLDYYTNYVGANKIVFHDGGSTDNTHQIINSYPNTEIIQEYDEETNSIRDLKIWNEEWKRYRNEYDWMIVCTTDEFLYHENIKDKLLEYKNNGITIPKIEGFDMISLEHPKFEKEKYLPRLIEKGIKDPLFLNKNIIFNPKEIDINFLVGCHKCKPTGNVIYSDNYDFKLLHFKWLSYEFLIDDSKRKHERLSKKMLDDNSGFHYRLYIEKTYDEYLDRYNRAIYVLKENNIVSNLNDLLIDYTLVELNGETIIVSPHTNTTLENLIIIVKNLNGDMIFSETRHLSADVSFWCVPDNKSYLNGFYVELINNKNELIFKSKIIS